MCFTHVLSKLVLCFLCDKYQTLRIPVVLLRTAAALSHLLLQVLSYRAEVEEPGEEDILAWWRKNKLKT